MGFSINKDISRTYTASDNNSTMKLQVRVLEAQAAKKSETIEAPEISEVPKPRQSSPEI